MLLILPFQFAFKNKPSFDEDFITASLITIDILYLIKLILQSFLLPYVDDRNNIVNQPREIFRHFIGYALLTRQKSRMAYRVISILPYYLIDVDWAMIKMVSLLEVNAIRDFVRDMTALVSPG